MVRSIRQPLLPAVRLHPLIPAIVPIHLPVIVPLPPQAIVLTHRLIQVAVPSVRLVIQLAQARHLIPHLVAVAREEDVKATR